MRRGTSDPCVSNEIPGRVRSAIRRAVRKQARALMPTFSPLTRGLSARLAGVFLLGIVAWSVWDFPIIRLPIAVGLLGYGGLLVRWQWAYLVVLPIAIPSFDLAPFSGRFFWDEFDLLLVTTLGVRLLARSEVAPVKAEPSGARLVVALFVLSACASAVIGLLPVAPLDANAFSNYHSTMNALRAIKGLVFASALFWLFDIDARSGIDVGNKLIHGLAFGLCAAGAVIIWERAAFTELWNFTEEFRVTGFFSSMNTGGAYIDGFLVLTLPAAMALAVESAVFPARLGFAMITAVGAYGIAVTYSRGAIFGAVVAITVFAAGLFAQRQSAGMGGVRPAQSRRFLIVAALALLVVVPALSGSFASARFSSIKTDIDVRVAHWKDALGTMGSAIATYVLGKGSGRYPAAYAWNSREATIPATYRFVREDTNTFVRLGAGSPLYFEQVVDIRPNTDYLLTVKLRTEKPGATLTVFICETALLYSFHCESLPIHIPESDAGKWSTQAVPFNSGQLGDGPRFGSRLTKLAINNGDDSRAIDVDDVTLVGPEGRNLVQNGDFAAGMDLWYFSTSSHLPWHVKNLFIHVFFEQGIVGLLLLIALLLTALWRQAIVARAGLDKVVFLASLAGFLCVGVFDSLVDAPRIAFLFYFVLLCALSPAPPWRHGH